MFKTIYPAKSNVLYSQFLEKNVGKDQVLDLVKIPAGEPAIEGDETTNYAETYNSRILLQFDLSEISSSIQSGKISSNFYSYLTLKATSVQNLSLDYTIYAYPISGSWTQGSGFFNNNPEVTNGSSWKYRDSKLQGTLWKTGSYNAGSTGSYSTIKGGGNWFTSSFASQRFQNENPDARIDVTSIVREWISGSIPNEGLIIKHHDSVEFDSSTLGLIQWFSPNSHTIFVPRLEIFWDDSNLSGTGSFTEIGSDDFVLYLKNIRESYAEEKPKIRIGVRERYPVATYATSSNYLISKRLPTGSYFQIQDVVTDDVIIPFHPSGTKISCDTDGNYFKADMMSLLPERAYKFVFKTLHDSDETIRIIDDNYIFKIRRN
jgi:hypothetical protein